MGQTVLGLPRQAYVHGQDPIIHLIVSSFPSNPIENLKALETVFLWPQILQLSLHVISDGNSM